MSSFNDYKNWLSRIDRHTDCGHICFCGNDCDKTIERGETRRHTFELPFKADLIKDLEVLIRQRDFVVIRKRLTDVKILDNYIYYDLTELDTSRFVPNVDAEVQLKVSFEDGDVLVSNIFVINVENSIMGDILTYTDSYLYALDVDVNLKTVRARDYVGCVSGMTTLKCRFSFDPTWDGFNTKEVIFKDQYNNTARTEVSGGGDCVIPAEIIDKPGLIYIGVTGSDSNGVVKSTSWSNSIRVANGCYTEESVNE